ncbi:hypothetical protein Aduo_005813 [Ancylostoma duodenale]
MSLPRIPLPPAALFPAIRMLMTGSLPADPPCVPNYSSRIESIDLGLTFIYPPNRAVNRLYVPMVVQDGGQLSDILILGRAAGAQQLIPLIWLESQRSRMSVFWRSGAGCRRGLRGQSVPVSCLFSFPQLTPMGNWIPSSLNAAAVLVSSDVTPFL